MPTGTILINGDNGHGKSNLLEAMYMMAIGKSTRASNERDLITKGIVTDISYSKISCEISELNERIKLAIHYECIPAENMDGFTVKKYVRVNESPKRISDLIGNLNAILFTVEELDLVFGIPSYRRRYIDILLSQIDKEYLKSLLHYQKCHIQRNSLLKSIRDGSSVISELDFWDQQLSIDGSLIMNKRIEILNDLSIRSKPIHRLISDMNEDISCQYKSNIDISQSINIETLHKLLLETLKINRNKDIAQGMTSIGPHRDDITIIINNKDASRFASRGQARTAIFSLKYAEAQFLKIERGKEPVLLLDDVLSELDPKRQEKILQLTSNYEQSIITTAEKGSISNMILANTHLLKVHDGLIQTHD